ncbi:MAG: hypothetical protein COT84_05855 [Chlamydiae bacterium CG10_big_fil_rev_8_21_14_0_10_35_9]|nr:MAG: hypothetical protein COT84_05855 [Chlamydiae bacterium CG10_big_fil_rev_8_21_14_0_10_35_9]
MRCLLLLALFSSCFANEPSIAKPQLGALIDQKDVIVIDPSQRAQDFLEAYEVIKRGKSPQKIQFHLSDGRSLTNVLEMKPMKNGTLILFKISGSMGNQYELVPIENLVNITQQ